MLNRVDLNEQHSVKRDQEKAMPLKLLSPKQQQHTQKTITKQKLKRFLAKEEKLSRITYVIFLGLRTLEMITAGQIGGS